jgi:hypothetical protein
MTNATLRMTKGQIGIKPNLVKTKALDALIRDLKLNTMGNHLMTRRIANLKGSNYLRKIANGTMI